jgi:zinc transport system substrate-binding protein
MQGNKKWLIAGICAVALVSALVLTQRAPSSSGDRSQPTVVVTIAPQAAFVKEVAGDLVRTVTVLPPGANHETFSLPPQDMEKIGVAKLYLALGLPPERANILPKVSELNRNLKIIDVQKEVAKAYPPRYFAPDDQDPHIWLSPKRAIAMVQLTARELGLIDPAHRQTFEENAKRFISQIEAVDREIQAALKPMANRTFIVFHPAFGYFADEYNLSMVALEERARKPIRAGCGK